MKKVFIQLLSFLFLFSGFAKTVPEPDWFRNYKTVFSKSEYLAQRGSGKTAEEAKTDAASQLARYFQTTVNSNLSTTMSSITGGIDNIEETKVIDEVSVISEVEFIGLEFTESWYYKAEKKWYAVAWINCEDAWIQYKPKIDGEKSKFYGFYKKAGKETDSIIKIRLLKSAWKTGSDFLEKLEYGRVINPKEEEKYFCDRETISNIPSLIEIEQRHLTVQVQIIGDYANLIEVAVKNALEKNGFTVGERGNYLVKVVISPNENGSAPLSIMPSVLITLKNKDDKAIYSYGAKLTEKTIAYTFENAQKKAYPKLAEKINSEINF